jgi:hypothetical protein
VKAWLNLFRDGDYIGGPVDGARNSTAGVGGHTGYFSDPRIWQRMLTEAKRTCYESR